MIADRARFRNAKKIERLTGYRLPELAFSGTMLEALCSKPDYDKLDFGVRDQFLAFLKKFLRCDCKDSPLCGCPEKKFSKEFRTEIKNLFGNHVKLEHEQCSGCSTAVE